MAADSVCLSRFLWSGSALAICEAAVYERLDSSSGGWVTAWIIASGRPIASAMSTSDQPFCRAAVIAVFERALSLDVLK
jgi:hypothetical protein